MGCIVSESGPAGGKCENVDERVSSVQGAEGSVPLVADVYRDSTYRRAARKARVDCNLCDRAPCMRSFSRM
jgi:hypothetical protein